MDLSRILVIYAVPSIGELKIIVLEIQVSFSIQTIVLPFAIIAKKIGLFYFED